MVDSATPLILFSALLASPPDSYTYHQATGKLSLAGKVVGVGYSGKGVGKNNPAREREKNVGPIPAGLYQLGPARTWKGMPNVFDLTPVGHDAHGRTAFLIHGDSRVNPGNASEGCIILPPDVRTRIAAGGITRLQVVSEGWLAGSAGCWPGE